VIEVPSPTFWANQRHFDRARWPGWSDRAGTNVGMAANRTDPPADGTELPAEAELRAEAEGHLRALAGAGARLRDDQWTAISALVTGHRRALVVQRTGWG
jgi:superfamily II DNA helicase RecQ